MKDPLIEELSQIFGPQRLILGNEVSERFPHIWRMNEPLRAKAVVLPETTEEVSLILSLCHSYRQPVVTHGGLTNLVGGTDAKEEEIVMAMERMNRIEEVDSSSRTMTVQAGVILERVQEEAKQHNLLFPLNFGAKGSAQMGGIIATNAGGLRVFRFGMTRSQVLGLEAVLADGTIISSLKKIIKDNSAYDLKQLFIGSEGTLGVITRAVLKLVETPKSRTTAFVSLDNYQQVVEFLKFMDSNLAGTLSGFELMWESAYKVLTSPPAVFGPPLPYGHPYYVLLESLGSHQKEDQSRLIRLLESAVESGMVADAAPAHSDSDINRFWTIREDVSVFLAHCRNAQQFDISVPVAKIGEIIKRITHNLLQVQGVENVFTFGHVADGNIHIIVGKEQESTELIKEVNEVVYQPLKAVGGSISAEHGIGLQKKAYLTLSRSPEEIALMKTLKDTLDPHHLLNRGKVLESSLLDH